MQEDVMTSHSHRSRRSDRAVLIGGLVAALLGGAAPASAQTLKGGSVAVTATVASACSISSGSVNFGSTVFATSIYIGQMGTLPIQCNSTSLAPTVALDYGQNASGTQRRMKSSSGAFVPYELRQGSATATLWDNTAHSVAITSTSSQNVPIFGVVPSLPTGTADGSYTDTVAVTLTY